MNDGGRRPNSGIDGHIAVIKRVLLAQNHQIVLAESCTGGLLAEQLTAIPGASVWFYGSFVTYQARAKIEMLGISGDELNKHGLVSEYTALALAKQSLARSSADYSITLTGLAGPAGDGSGAHVGELWIGWGDVAEDTYAAKHFDIAADRAGFRIQACALAISEFATYLQKVHPAPTGRSPEQ